MCEAWNAKFMKKMAAPALVTIGLMSPGVALAEKVPSAWDPAIKVEYLKKGKQTPETKPKAGEMVEIRFKGSYKGNVFDDTFSTPDPYFYRAGVGILMKGVDDTVTNM